MRGGHRIALYLSNMAVTKRKVFAISGSTRSGSSNHRLLQTLAVLTADRLDWSVYPSVADLPHFVPGDEVPAAVTEFRQQLLAADGVVICTPEYAHGVPGSLKNAIDWTVSNSDFSGRPTVLITASTDGKSSHASLLETLTVIEAGNVQDLQLIISFIRSKINDKGEITDGETLEAVKKLMEDFISTIG